MRYRFSWETCRYCGESLRLDCRDKKTIKVDGKKQKISTKSFCNVYCIKPSIEFEERLKGRLEKRNPEINKLVDELLMDMIRRKPIKSLNKKLVEFGRKKLVVVSK